MVRKYAVRIPGCTTKSYRRGSPARQSRCSPAADWPAACTPWTVLQEVHRQRKDCQERHQSSPSSEGTVGFPDWNTRTTLPGDVPSANASTVLKMKLLSQFNFSDEEALALGTPPRKAVVP